MKSFARCCIPFLLSAVFCSPLFSEAITVAEGEGNHSAAMPDMTMQGTIAAPALAADSQGTNAPSRPPAERYGWHIAVYPVLVWAPIFGSSFTLPPPTGSQTPTTGSTDRSLNGAYFGGARFEVGKWSAGADFMWAALHAKRETPIANVDLDFVFGDAIVGRKLLPGLYAEGGARRLALDIHATSGSQSASRSPGYWDPLIGLTYDREFGKKWRILLHGDGGGFGVGSDVDVTATGRAEWQFVRHCGITMGYGGIHISDSDTSGGQTVTINSTLHGPVFGLGIFF